VAAAVTLSATRETIRTRALLACGVLAGPVFVVTAGIQVLTRGGFDLGHHPISLLSLGDLGWIQIANFIVAGAGLIAGGVFVPDPALGYPRARRTRFRTRSAGMARCMPLRRCWRF
jgi:hypothetical protein